MMFNKPTDHGVEETKDPEVNYNSTPSLKDRNGRPILMSFYACWERDFEDGTEQLFPEVMGSLLMVIIAMLVELVRYLRESLESSAHLVISRNKIDVKTKEVTPEVEDCAPNDEDCLRIVEEVVVPVRLERCRWRHLLNSLLYGLQCGLQLQCLLGVLSLNIPLIGGVLVGVFLGRLCFYWRPYQKPFIRPKKTLSR